MNLSRLLCKNWKIVQNKIPFSIFGHKCRDFRLFLGKIKKSENFAGVKIWQIPRLRLTRVWICLRKTTRWTSWATSSDSTWNGLRTSKTSHLNIWKSSLCVDKIFHFCLVTSFLMAFEVDFAVHTYSWELFRQLSLLVECTGCLKKTEICQIEHLQILLAVGEKYLWF